METSTAVEYIHSRPIASAGIRQDVRVAQPWDESRLLATLTLAFANDPPVRWLFPDARHYVRHFPEFVRAFGGGAVALGTAYHVEDFTACALWLPPGEEPDEAAVIEVIERSVARDRHEEVFALFEAMGAVHPTEPHWYLPLIGADGTSQGRGLGSTLLRHTLKICDRDGLPAYLEATTERNIRLYEHHGFRCLAPLRIGGCPPVTPMWREPRSAP